MSVALGTPPAPFAGGGTASTGARTAPTPPVVPAVWPNALARRTEDAPVAESPSVSGAGRRQGAPAAPRRSA
ncbi:hypothetical protein, partial [Streptomyces sp. CBMA123]|uniref:hypothetical protein n=1 Tax=Streptomyces sp. CBMA123 TaxID=1896313 RepID=UPI001CB803B1